MTMLTVVPAYEVVGPSLRRFQSVEAIVRVSRAVLALAEQRLGVRMHAISL